MLSALVAGGLVRAGARDGGGAGIIVMGATALCAVLFLCMEVVAVLQGVQAREAVSATFRNLPDGFRCSGRVRVTGWGRRPVLVDQVVVTPEGEAYAVVVDGSTRPPAAGDPLDGVGALIPAARRAAEAVAAAAAARVLGGVPLPPGVRVDPCIVVARRPITPGRRAGVFTVAAGDFAHAIPPAVAGR